MTETDEHGRLASLRCHDGELFAVETLDTFVELKIRRTDGTGAKIVLAGVKKLLMNNFLEGNIVDSAYLWISEEIPESQYRATMQAFGMTDEEFSRIARERCLFVLDSSYGAEIRAIVDAASIGGLS